MTKQILQQALEALELAQTMLRVGMPEYDASDVLEVVSDAIEALREALATMDDYVPCYSKSIVEMTQQGEQQPVAWRGRCTKPLGEWVLFYRRQPSQESFLNMEWEPLYAGAAPAAQPDTWTDDGGWTFPIEKPAQPITELDIDKLWDLSGSSEVRHRTFAHLLQIKLKVI